MAFEGGVFLEAIGRKSGAPMSGIIVLIKGNPKSLLSLPKSCESTRKSQLFASLRGLSLETDHAGNLISDFQPQNCDK